MSLFFPTHHKLTCKTTHKLAPPLLLSIPRPLLSFPPAPSPLQFIEVDTAVDEDSYDADAGVTPVDLPPPKVGELEAYDAFLTELLDARQASMDNQDFEQRRAAIMKLKGFGYHMHAHLDTFFETFETCDDLERNKELGIIYNVSFAMMLSCMPELFEALTETPERLEQLIGTFEVKPSGAVTRHREYLESDTQFLEIEPVGDGELRFLIRKLYYINYIKDVILAGVIDDQLPFVLDSHAVFASGSVLERILQMPEYLASILSVSSDQSHQRTRKQVCVCWVKLRGGGKGRRMCVIV